MRFDDWLAETLALQREAFRTDPPALEGEEFAEYIRWNVLAAHAELSELLEEIPWKPWARVRGRPDLRGRGLAVKELVDALHFIANVACALGVTDAELTQVYEGKMEVNRARQAHPSGYDPKQSKCRRCGRAREDIEAHGDVMTFLNGVGPFCPRCHVEISAVELEELRGG